MATLTGAEQNKAGDPPPAEQQSGPTPMESDPPPPPVDPDREAGGGVEITEPGAVVKTFKIAERRPKRTKEERTEIRRQQKIQWDIEEAERMRIENLARIEHEKLVAIFRLHYYHEEKMLYDLSDKFFRSDISNLKIHVKIKDNLWNTVMTGEKFLNYMKNDMDPIRLFNGKTEERFTAKHVAECLHKLGRYRLSNEARWAMMVCGRGVPGANDTIGYFFALLTETLKIPDNRHLLNELRFKANTETKDVGELLLILVKDKFFERNLITFSCALDDRRAFRWKEKLQTSFIKSFHYYNTEEQFQAKLLELAEAQAAREAAMKEQNPQLMET